MPPSKKKTTRKPKNAVSTEITNSAPADFTVSAFNGSPVTSSPHASPKAIEREQMEEQRRKFEEIYNAKMEQMKNKFKELRQCFSEEALRSTYYDVDEQPSSLESFYMETNLMKILLSVLESKKGQVSRNNAVPTAHSPTEEETGKENSNKEEKLSEIVPVVWRKPIPGETSKRGTLLCPSASSSNNTPSIKLPLEDGREIVINIQKDLPLEQLKDKYGEEIVEKMRATSNLLISVLSQAN